MKTGYLQIIMFQYLEDNQLFKSGEINDDETNSIECKSHIWMSDK